MDDVLENELIDVVNDMTSMIRKIGITNIPEKADHSAVLLCRSSFDIRKKAQMPLKDTLSKRRYRNDV